jgi:TonB-linked SusC/RagA family outer membrane protein
MNMDNELSKHFKLKSGMSLSSSKVRKIWETDVFKQVLNSSPWSTYYNKDHIYVDPTTGAVTNDGYVYGNVYSNLERNNHTEKTNQYNFNLDLETKIVEGLVNNTRASYDLEFWNSSDFWADDVVTDIWNGADGNSNVTKEKKGKGKWQIEDIISYSKTIGEHNILMLSGVSLEGYTEEYSKGYMSGAPGTDYASNSFDAGYTGADLGSYETGWRTMGIPVRFDYNYNHKYFFQANCRTDASSKFMPEKRWGFFPSLSVGWTISEESFMDNYKDWLTQLKLRANWGKSGNNRIDDYSAYTMLSTTTDNTVVFGRSPLIYRQGWSASTYGNPNISWEKTTGSNIGVDWSLFQGSFSGSFDVFKKVTSDMLLQLPLPLSFGSIKNSSQQDVTPWQNAGSVDNTGYEIVLSYKKTIDDLSFEIRGNFSQVANKITKLGEDGNAVLGSYYNANGIQQTYLTYSAVGFPIGMFYGWKIDRTKYANGIWHSSDGDASGNIPASAGALPASGSKVGDFIYTDMNGDGVINEQDKTFIGSPHPKFTYGFNINVAYKNFELTAFFQGVYGNKILNTMRYYSYGYHGTASAVGNSTVPDLLSNSWQAGVNEDAEFPRVSDKNDAVYMNNYRLSDFYIEDGSYCRLKNLQLSYLVPKKTIEKMKLTNMKLSVGATNLFTWTKYTGFDPEIGGDNISLGVDQGTYPQCRTYMGSITIEF